MSQVRHGSDRFEQERIGRPLWDEVYRELWGNDIVIERDLGPTMEKGIAVDVRVTRPGIPFPLYGQEKTLGYIWGKRYDTLTVELEQNDNEHGDAYKIDVAFYACAYLNEAETDFDHGGLVDWPSLVRETWAGEVVWSGNRNDDGRARASFVYVNFDRVPDWCLLWRRHRPKLSEQRPRQSEEG